MQPYTAPPGKAWGLGAGPFVLSGRPPMLSGEIELVNRSRERVKVRALATKGTPPGEQAESSNLVVTARLEPGRHQRVVAHLEVTPATPPGRFEAEVVAGDERAPLLLHVFENPAITLAPRRIALRGAPGDSLSHRLLITNPGNLSWTVPAVVLVHLEERDWFGRSLVYALREMDADEGHQAYLDRVVREMKATDVPPMRVEISVESRELPPAAIAEATLELKVPKKLVKGRTYVRTIPFMGTELTFQIECDGSDQSSKRRPR